MINLTFHSHTGADDDNAGLVLAGLMLALSACDTGSGAGEGGEPRANMPAAGAATAGAERPVAATQARQNGEIPAGFEPFLDPQGRITRGRCHMDFCSWVKWDDVKIIKADKDQIELKASVRTGGSEHPTKADEGPDYPDGPDGVAIEWDAQPSVAQYHCSKTRPSMQWGDEARFFLPLREEFFLSGATEGATISYFVACHSDVSPALDEAYLVAQGYRSGR